MNHELIMLRECTRMKRLSQILTKEARYRAIKSHSSQNIRNGTMGQIEEICQIIQLRDECLLFWRATLDALKAMDEDKSCLLALYYLKRAKTDVIAQRFDTSISTIYRKLHIARRQFGEILKKFGYDARWFKSEFGDIEFISARLKSNA